MEKENFKHRTAVGLILNSYGEILLQKKDREYFWHPSMWCFFGGQLNEREEPIDAFKREIREELGVQLENIRFFKEYPFRDTAIDGKSRGGILYAFEAYFKGKIEDITLNEGNGFAFFRRNEITQLPIVSHNKEIIIEYYKHLERTSEAE